LNIRFGIYAGRACVGNGRDRSLQGQRTHPAAIVLGPIDNRGLPKIEAHLLNFTGNLYGKKITLSLKKFIRPFRKFSTVDNLKLQIRKDLEVINKLQQ
jgi:riboflavin kinase/FMN adenylyltransferase